MQCSVWARSGGIGMTPKSEGMIAVSGGPLRVAAPRSGLTRRFRPWRASLQHRIGDDQQLAHHRDQGQAFGFPGVHQAAIEGRERFVEAYHRQAGNIEWRSDLRSSAFDMPLAALVPAVLVARCPD